VSDKILCVDDDPEVLAAFQRAFRKRFHIDTETAADRALLTLEQQGPYAVVVADLGMPGMNGLQFLAEVKKAAPQSVRIMLKHHRCFACFSHGTTCSES
jgi:DNA-binding NtrC family response regulator